MLGREVSRVCHWFASAAASTQTPDHGAPKHIQHSKDRRGWLPHSNANAERDDNRILSEWPFPRCNRRSWDVILRTVHLRAKRRLEVSVNEVCARQHAALTCQAVVAARCPT